MAVTDRLLLIIHIGFAIFTLGPLTAATMSTPRYIRRGDIAVLRYLRRMTQLYGVLTLGIFLFGIFLAEGQFAKVWLTASMTLFIVALVLLLIVERDQGRAIRALEEAAKITSTQAPPEQSPETPAAEGAAKPGPAPARPSPPRAAENVAQVERGRIAAISGVIALIWLVILILMVWR
jgi:hypothetical protein